jgi:NADH dehydrogenase (ubiquinone) 1 alpha/beta subcomplex 1, acyl-carrier protein
MFRSAIVRSLRASVPRTVLAAPRIQITSAVRPSQFVPVFNAQTLRFYSAPASLSKEEVEGRIVNLLKNFDKVCIAFRFGYKCKANIFV